MPRKTKKYLQALKAADGLSLGDFSIQDDLYTALNASNLFWDLGDKRWVPAMAPDPASQVIKIRVWGKATTVEDTAEMLVRRLTREGLTLLERSRPYLCRPPKQLEARIYLSFSAND